MEKLKVEITTEDEFTSDKDVKNFIKSQFVNKVWKNVENNPKFSTVKTASENKTTHTIEMFVLSKEEAGRLRKKVSLLKEKYIMKDINLEYICGLIEDIEKGLKDGN